MKSILFRQIRNLKRFFLRFVTKTQHILHSDTRQGGDTDVRIGREYRPQRPMAGMKCRSGRKNVIYQKDVRVFNGRFPSPYLKSPLHIVCFAFNREFGLRTGAACPIKNVGAKISL